MVEPLAESPPGPQLYDAAGLEAWLAREGLTNETLLRNIHEQVEHLYDLKAADPTVKYTIINIDGKPIHNLTVKRSELQFK